jgi:hypothetical protein
MNWCTHISPWPSLHSTSLHLRTLHTPQNLLPFPSRPFPTVPFQSLHFWWLPPHIHFALFITFLTFFLKLLDIQERARRTSAGSWFQSWMVLFTSVIIIETSSKYNHQIYNPQLFVTQPLIKVKLSLCSTNYALYHEGVWGSGCVYPHFLDFGTSWRWVVSFTSRPLYPPVKSSRYPLDRRLGESQSRAGRREENSWPYRESNSDTSVVQPVASRYTDDATQPLTRDNINTNERG